MAKSRNSRWEIATVFDYPAPGPRGVYVACEDGWRPELVVGGPVPKKMVYSWDEACEIANALERYNPDRVVFVRLEGMLVRREWPNTRAKRAALAEAWEEAQAAYTQALACS